MVRSLRRMLVFVLALVTLAVGVVVLNQTLQLAELAERIHPLFGRVVLWGLIAGYVGCLAVPLVVYYRLPAALDPPASAEGPEFERHLDRLRRRLAVNPLCEGRPLERRDQLEEAIARLDRRTDELLHETAGRVFLTTAVSQNGSLDALVVLAAQLKLIWDVAHVYHQRPSLKDMGKLYANVLTTAFISGQLEDLDLSEQIQPVLSSVLGSAAGAVPGLQAASTVFVTSVVTGSANAFLTLRVGIITREYSRALTRPRPSALKRSAALAAAGMLGAIAVSGATRLSSAIAKASGRRFGSVIADLGGKVRGAGASIVDRLQFAKDASPDDPEPGTSGE